MAISAKRVSERLAGTDELALLDVREQGVHYRGHPFFACSAPLSRLELMIGDLVPRRSVPVVVLDGGDEGLAEKAMSKLKALGYSDVAILEGGCAGWKQAGLELFSGVNVPSKAFGEFVEHHYETPRIPARGAEGIRRRQDGDPRLPSVRGIPPHEHPGRRSTCPAPSSPGACTTSRPTRTRWWW